MLEQRLVEYADRQHKEARHWAVGLGLQHSIAQHHKPRQA